MCRSKSRAYVHEYRGYLRETQLEADKCKGRRGFRKYMLEVYDAFLKLRDLQRLV